MKKTLIRSISLCGLFLILACGSSQQNLQMDHASKKFTEELTDLENKLRKNPTDIRLRVRLGMLLLQEEHYDAALAQFDSALTLQPSLPAAKFGRAEVKFLTGRFSEGLTAYLEVLGSPEADQYTSAIAERVGAPHAIRQLTMPPGENMMARFSPDGRAIVFQSNRDGNWEIYRALPDGSQPIRLTNDPAVDESPCFSPDGHWIAFVRAEEQSPNSPRDVYLMEALTGENLICISRHHADDWNPTFSPKGGQLAFVSDRDDMRAVEPTERQSDIFLFSLSDSSLTRFSQGFGDKSAPCFTPDGASLVYVNNVNGAFDIFEQRLGATQPISLLTKSGPKGAPQVSPNGKQIVYFEKHDQNLDLFLFERDRGHAQRLTYDPSVEAFPTFSPDGNEIFFTSNRDGEYQIYALNLRTPISRTELITALNHLLDQQKLSSQ